MLITTGSNSKTGRFPVEGAVLFLYPVTNYFLHSHLHRQDIGVPVVRVPRVNPVFKPKKGPNNTG